MITAVLFSGGADSTVALAKELQDGSENVEAWFYGYGQAAYEGEAVAVTSVADYYGVHTRFHFLHTWDAFESALTHQSLDAALEDGGPATFKEDGRLALDLPFRNGVIIADAAARLECAGGGELVLSTHAPRLKTAMLIPDATEEFATAMMRAIEVGTGKKVHLRSPFVTWYKDDIFALGNKLGVPWELTWSCYRGGKTQCGTCIGCAGTVRAFDLLKT